MRKVFIILVLLPLQVWTQNFVFNQNCIESYEAIIDLRFDEAQQMLSTERRTNPENLCPVLLENYIDFFNILIQGNESAFRVAEANKKIRLNAINTLSDTDPHKKWAISAINLQWAFGHLMFEDYYTAAKEIRNSFLLIEANSKLFPEYQPNELQAGLLYTLVGSVPTSYQWIMRLASMYGTTDEGISKINKYVEWCQSDPSHAPYTREAKIYQALVTSFAGNHKKALQITNSFTPHDLESNLVVYVKATIEKYSHCFEQMAQTLQLRKQNKGAAIIVLDYLEGNLQLNNGNLKASENYQKYLQHYKGKEYVVDSWRKLAWIALLEDDLNGYKTNIEKCKTFKAYNDTDKQALREANSGIVPDKHLLWGRILFDGAHFEEALSQLQTADTTEFSKAQKLEWLYRKARVFDGMNNIDEAQKYYLLTLNRGENETYYFAANSALKLAEMFERLKRYNEAETYYKRCLTLHPDEYRTSIEQEAKAGLNRLNSFR